MADVYSVGATLTENTFPARRVENFQRGADMAVFFDQYEAAALPAGDNVIMFRVRKDARIVDWQLYHDAMGASTTLALALRNVATGVETVIDAATASTSAGTREPSIDEWPVTVGAESFVVVKLAGGAGTGTIKLRMYVADPL